MVNLGTSDKSERDCHLSKCKHRDQREFPVLKHAIFFKVQHTSDMFFISVSYTFFFKLKKSFSSVDLPPSSLSKTIYILHFLVWNLFWNIYMINVFCLRDKVCSSMDKWEHIDHFILFAISKFNILLESISKIESIFFLCVCLVVACSQDPRYIFD